MCADLRRRGCDSVGMGRGFNVATDWPGISGFVGLTLLQNEATVGPRSGHDQATIVILELGRLSFL